MATSKCTAETTETAEPTRGAAPSRGTVERVASRGRLSRTGERWPVELIALGLGVGLTGAAAFGALAMTSTWATAARSGTAASVSADPEADLANLVRRDERHCCRETR